MSFTMVKKQLFIIHLLCVITLSASAKSIGFVKEFNHDHTDLKEKFKGLHETTKITDEKLKAKHIDDLKRPNTKDQSEINSNLQEEDSVYTLSDLEEVVSREIVNGPVEDKKVENNNQLSDDEVLLDIYTESDLDETKSLDKVKPEVDKKSSSYLYVPHKRNKRGATTNADVENGEGSGEGSGDLPTSL